MATNDIRDNRFSRDLERFRSCCPHRQGARRLLFPRSWEPELASYVGPMNEAVTQWFVDRGLVDEPGLRCIVEKEQNDLYGGYPFSWASFDRCLIVAKINALWVLFDDVVTERVTGHWNGSDLPLDVYDRALRNDDTVPCADPWFRAWRELIHSMASSMSCSWRSRFVDSFMEWLRFATRERETYAPHLEKGSLPDLDTYVNIRSVTIGVQPIYSIIEFAQGFEIPEEASLCNEMLDLHEIGKRLICFANDLCGLEKDLEIGWPNAVTVVQHQYGLSLEEATDYAVRLHNEYVSTFVDIERSLPRFDAHTDALVKHYLSRVHYVIRGFAEWEVRAERYRWKGILANERPIVTASFTDTYEP